MRMLLRMSCGCFGSGGREAEGRGFLSNRQHQLLNGDIFGDLVAAIT